MTHVCCPECRLRFGPAVAVYLGACPRCGGPAQPMAEPESVLGFRLLTLDDLPPSLPEALASSLSIDPPALQVDHPSRPVDDQSRERP